MSAIVALLLVLAVESQIPSDAEIAGRVRAAISDAMRPLAVEVEVTRRSSVSQTVRRLDVRMEGFTAEALPFAATPAQAAGAADGRRARKVKTYRIVDATVSCRRFRVQSLPIEEMTLRGREVRVSRDALSAGVLDIVAAERAEGELLVSADGLTRFLRGLPGMPLKDIEVRISATECEVTGKTEGIVGVPVTVTGLLTAREGANLYLDNARIKVSAVPLPTAAVERILAGFTPLVDLNTALELPVPLRVDHTMMGESSIRLAGTLGFRAP